MFMLLLAAPAGAAEEQTHLFDATLSLTGGCDTSNADPIPDPGCPGGEHPPKGQFQSPSSVTTDSYGDIYVSSFPAETGGQEARIDIFDPAGHFLTEMGVPGVQKLAVDANGYLYAYVRGIGVGPPPTVERFDPTKYDPAAGEIEYGSPPISIATEIGGGGIAVNPVNQHLYVAVKGGLQVKTYWLLEYGPPTAGVPNEPISEDTIGKGTLNGEGDNQWVAVDATHHRIYAADYDPITDRMVIRVFEEAAPYKLLETIDGSTIPGNTNRFVQFRGSGGLPVAVEEETGHVFVGDIQAGKKVFEFEEDGSYVWTYSKPTLEGGAKGIAIDNGAHSPNLGELYVPSGYTGAGHLYAFEKKPEPKAPVVEAVSVDGVQSDEAVLHAKINPKALAAHYSFEYVTQQAFEASGFEGAAVAGEGTVPAANEGLPVSAAARGLSPDTAYRFRVVATNECEPGGCSGEAEGTFHTFPLFPPASGCANEALRTGPSAALPDCRAYELVTPVNTGGKPPLAPGGEIADFNPWGGPTASAQGEDLLFVINGGVIPGTEGTGVTGDAYLATRTPGGWQSASSSPNGAQAVGPSPGGLSPDQRYMIWNTGNFSGGSLEAPHAVYLRYPDGSFQLVGQGSLGTQLAVDPHYVSAGATHVIFTSSGLEPEAPEPIGVTPTAALYDRTPDGVTHVVSLLPGEVTPAPGQGALFEGASDDGSAVAFGLGEKGSPLYLRVDDKETLQAGPAEARSAGLSADGRYLYYLLAGNLYRFDAQTQETATVAETGDARPVLVPASGEGVYFISKTALGAGPNPQGAAPQPLGENLYYWDGSQLHFLGTVTKRDAEGEFRETRFFDGLELGLFAKGAYHPFNYLGRSLGVVPARADSQGGVLLFESRADLTGYEAGGSAQVYRYDAGQGTLECLSCPASGAASTTDAGLLSASEPSLASETPLYDNSVVPNVSADGRRAFFQSSERLAPADNDGVQDVYEWEAAGKGGCATPGGCLYLISSGQSGKPSYLFGASESGDDVFISTSDLLNGFDPDETASIYDARVGGGFPPPPAPAGECLGETCQPAAGARSDPTPASAIFEGQGNVVPGARHCRKGTHAVRRKGRRRCVANKHKHHGKRGHKRANTGGRAHR